jgi:gamma-glutamyltranspeptidase/glutathione hydrolase
MSAARFATLPFELATEEQVIGHGSVTTTQHRRHGVLRLDGDALIVQWRVDRVTHRVGPEIRTDAASDGLRDVTVPLRLLGSARVRVRRRLFRQRHELVLVARDLTAWDRLAGEDGFAFAHPAELVLPVRAVDREVAEEFASELALAIADRQLADVTTGQLADGTTRPLGDVTTGQLPGAPPGSLLPALGLLVGVLSVGELPAQRPTTLAGRSTVYAPHGMVATSQPLASAAALEVLRTGGNAVDAAIAASAVLGVTEPHMTGIGGDMFAIVWLAKEQKLVAINASGRAGSRMVRDTLVARGFRAGSQQGAMSVTVPGALAGWDLLARTHGTRPLRALLQPAIGYARDGFPVTPIIAAQWAEQTELLMKDSAAAATYLPGGRAPRAGEWFSNADLARTMQAIADSGVAHFYTGALGRRIVQHVERQGGFLTLDDLRANEPTWVTPISVPFKGYRVWELPPNNQGIAALEMLRILEPYDLAGMGYNSAPYLHHLIEAKKLAYADLDRFVGDADHLELSAEEMLSDAFIAARRQLLNPTRAQERVDPGPARTRSETVYLTTADAEGNMVSFINSIYDYFGSGVVVPGTGFALHNRGAGFTLDLDLPNTVAPGKRPFHTLIPAFVTQTVNGRDEAYMSFGLMGGGVQAQAHVQFLLNHFVFGMDVQAAIDAPRFRHYNGFRVALEAPITDAVRTGLEGMGHVLIEQPPIAFGGAQAIIRLPQGWAAGSDPRKDGMAVGY